MPRLTAIRRQALDEMMKEALFEATVAVLSAHGVDGMTMDRVAAAAGMAKGNLYRYFSSKRDLLEFVHAKIVDPIFQDLDVIVAAEQPAVEKIDAELRMLIGHVAKHAQVFRLLFENDAAHSLVHSSERRSLKAASERLADIFRQGVAEGAFRPADPLLLANMYLGLCRGVLQTRPDLERPDQRETIHRLIFGALLHGIAVEKGCVG